MNSRRTVNIVCARAPVKVPCVPAIRQPDGSWRCSFCGARVRVVA